MVYNVIGLMSGSSLDGLDIAYVEITETGGQWSYELRHSECSEYDDTWKSNLKNNQKLSIPDFLELHTSYGRYIGQKVNEFIDRYNLTHKVHLIASHGHTAYHNPEKNTSFQLGDGASISALTQLHVVTDLRNKDVANQGQGAPIVPIADRYLWSDYDFCLNIGGIANVTINQKDPIAFDICTANQVLNFYSEKLGKKYDAEGESASKGTIDDEALAQLNDLDFYQKSGPKSLSNDYIHNYIDILDNLSRHEDALTTMCEHIAIQVKNSIHSYLSHPSQKLFITGGGAHNTYLISRIQDHLTEIEVVAADSDIIDNKEAIAMALIGILRWREENNVLSSVTGSIRDSVGGALWIN